jgi:hypothetical protein
MAATPAGRIDGGAEQAAVTTDVPPDDVEQNGQEREGGAVEDYGGALPVSVPERLGQHGGGERQERDVHQQHGVEEEHHAVGAADVVEHDVMVGPHLPDQHESQRDRPGAGLLPLVGHRVDCLPLSAAVPGEGHRASEIIPVTRRMR